MQFSTFIRSIDLSNNHLTDESASIFLRSLKKCLDIREINLDRNMISLRLKDVIEDQCKEHRQLLLQKEVPDDIATVRILTGVGEKKGEQEKLIAHERIKLNGLHSRMRMLSKENDKT